MTMIPVSQTFTYGRDTYSIEKYVKPGAVTAQPVVVMVHGTDGMGPESGPAIREFAAQIAAEDFLVFVPHYFDAADGLDTDPIANLFALRVGRVASYAPRLHAAVDHALADSQADRSRVGLIGMSLGGGLALQYAESVGAAKVHAVVDFFGYIADQQIYANAGKLPPTLVLHNTRDQVVPIRYSKELVAALDEKRIRHDSHYYDDQNPDRRDHPFKRGAAADVDSRARTIAWLKACL